MSYDPVRSKAFEVLYRGGTLAEAAHVAGVSVSTVQRWRDERKEEDAIKKARFGLMQRSAGWNPRAGRRDPKKRRDVP